MSTPPTTFPGTPVSGYISVANAPALVLHDNQAVAMQSFEQTPINPPGTVNGFDQSYYINSPSKGRIVDNSVV